MKVLIIGAGPTGLTAGLEFARQGIIPEIVDAKKEPSLTSRAVGILPHSIEILNRTGVGERILQEGVKFKQAHIQRGSTTLINLNVSEILHEDDFIIGLPQDRTESIMSEKLSEMGVHVRYNCAVTDIETTDQEATVTFADGIVKTYDWVIGADGVRSTVREKLGIAFNGYELAEDWSIADVELNSACEKTIHAWMLKGSHKERDALVMIPIGENRVRVISSTPDSLAVLPVKLDVKDVRRSGVFKISVRQAERYVQGRVVLAGDSAHAHSPVGGRGMNLGIDDAQAAVTAILQGKTSEYEIERKKIARRVIDKTEAVRKMLVSNNPITFVFVRVVTWLVQHVRFFQKKFARTVTEL